MQSKEFMMLYYLNTAPHLLQKAEPSGLEFPHFIHGFWISDLECIAAALTKDRLFSFLVILIKSQLIFIVSATQKQKSFNLKLSSD